MKVFNSKNNIIFLLVLSIFFFLKSTSDTCASKEVREKKKEGTIKKKKVANILKSFDKRLSVDFRGIEIVQVFKFIAAKGNINVTLDKDVKGKIALFLKDITIKQLIDTIVKRNKLAYIIEDNIMNVMTKSTYEQMYGEKYDDRRSTEILHLKYARPEDVFAMLDKMKSKLGNILLDKGTKTLVLTDTPGRLKKMKFILEKLDRKTISKTFKVNYSEIDFLKETILNNLTPKSGTVEIDKRSRTLIVTDFPEKFKKLENIINIFDKKPKQVLIEAKIMKIELNNDFKVGIDWEYFMPSARNLNLKGTFPGSGLVSPAQKLSIGKLPFDDMTATMSFIKTVGETEILSSPHIMVTDGEEAKILIGQVIPVISETTTTSQGIATSTPTVEYIDLGVKLFVKPTITENDFISMTVKPEVSELLGFEESSQGSRFPKRETSEAETTIIVKDGVTVIIGGLIKDDKKNSESKFPILGDLPFLGALFRNFTEVVVKSELVVFVTPHIISPGRNLSDWRLLSKKRKPLIKSLGKKRKALIN